MGFFQLKIDEFESNVNEVKDPFPPDDFPGNIKNVSPSTFIASLTLKAPTFLSHIVVQKEVTDCRNSYSLHWLFTSAAGPGYVTV